MTDYDSIQRRRNIVVGIFVLLGVIALGMMIWTFGDLPIIVSKARSFQIYVQFASAPGMQKDTPIQFCGYQIGRVIHVQAPYVYEDRNTGESYHQVKAILAINKKYNTIPSNVKVKLMRRGLGSSYIELVLDPNTPSKPKDSNRPETVFLVQGMLLQGITGLGSDFLPEATQKKLDQLAENLNRLTKSADDIIGDKENQQNLKQILISLTEMTQQATESLKEFQNFSAAGKESLQTTSTDFKNISAAMVDTSEELNATARELKLFLQKANDGSGSVAKLLNDGRLYENLLDSTEELEMVLERLNLLLTEWKQKGVRLKHL